MNGKRLWTALIILLALALLIALAGVMIIALGEGAGIIALICGLAACFPVLGELIRQQNKEIRAAKGQDRDK